jgi:KamA family protein
LVVSNRRLDALLTALETVPHLQRIRIHSRMPVVIPQRIDQGLLARIAQSPLRFVLVVHANHPRELDDDFAVAMRQLVAQGVLVLNQAVLLKGVNDRAEVLVELSEALFDCGVQPYYLHLLDPVAGAAHFDVDETQAKQIMLKVMACLPGYLVPRLVREVPGASAKTPIALI